MKMFRLGWMLLVLAVCAGSALAQEETDWRATYLSDLELAKQVIEEDHPGPVDPANAAFQRTLPLAYADAQRTASQVKSYTRYAIALQRFAKRFQDSSLEITFRRPLETVRTAGLYTAWRGGAFVVEEAAPRYGDAAAALKGSTVVACDGIPALRFFINGPLSWHGQTSRAADWFDWAPILLVDYGLPVPKAPKQCTFTKNGGKAEIELRWRPTTAAEVETVRQRIIAMPERPARISRLADDTIWVDLPSFAENETALPGVLETLAADVKKPGWKLLVLDLRGNAGGSKKWADEVTAALYGKDWATAAAGWIDSGVHTQLRVSNRNLQAMPRLAEPLRAAMAKRVALLDQPAAPKLATKPAAVALPGRVVIVTGPSCVGACLDFLDRMKLQASVVQVGQSTGSDSVYGEVATRELPSGLGVIHQPMQVVRDRKRGNNESYAPKAAYMGRLADTAELQKWIVANYRSW